MTIPDLCSVSFAAICMFSLIVFVTLHESTHLLVGRLLGIPASFLHITSVGVSPAIVAHTSPTKLALMNGIAPIETVVLGVLVFMILPRLSHRLPNIIIRFFAWGAIFGIPIWDCR